MRLRESRTTSPTWYAGQVPGKSYDANQEDSHADQAIRSLDDVSVSS